ncbi:alpha/beta hydrolase [Streptacidiphilus neutrinimicus]|uniref:alpha/beta hydrolase n=1 Tax=Streptacidiphilus neutrinimicus TaxID=105420 RepID=UPI0005AB2721|nr:alpha/beta hydrolase [Streptacidiphilus neutrinimicus]
MTVTGIDGGVGVEELSELALLHALAQGIDEEAARELLARVRRPWGGSPDAWGPVWTEAGDRLAGRGRPLDACRHYAVARFPYPGDEARRVAQRRCVESFDRWRQAQPTRIDRLTVTLDGERFVAWTAGLDPVRPRPLLLVLGGIVSLKEQWAPLLTQADALGVALAVTELPGVGENTLRYDPAAPRMLSALLDALLGLADVRRVAAVALSFGGHLALRCALDDSRIASVATVGAPVRRFFTDAHWWTTLPATTRACLAHTLRTPVAGLQESLRDWALTDEELARLAVQGVPVHYVTSLRDEIMPPGEAALLRLAGVPGTDRAFDDVHGAPDHLDETRLHLIGGALATFRAGPGAGG